MSIFCSFTIEFLFYCWKSSEIRARQMFLTGGNIIISQGGVAHVYFPLFFYRSEAFLYNSVMMPGAQGCFLYNSVTQCSNFLSPGNIFISSVFLLTIHADSTWCQIMIILARVGCEKDSGLLEKLEAKKNSSFQFSCLILTCRYMLKWSSSNRWNSNNIVLFFIVCKYFSECQNKGRKSQQTIFIFSAENSFRGQ